MTETGCKESPSKAPEAGRKSGRISIDRERCKGCYLCIRACPVQHIGKDPEVNAQGVTPVRAVEAANAKGCTGCGNCYTVCPDMCITVYEVTE